MPLHEEHHWMLLKDILQNHQEDCCGSPSECEQLERICHNLMQNKQPKDELQSILKEVQLYCKNGIHASDLNNHISLHQDKLSDWVDGINQYS